MEIHDSVLDIISLQVIDPSVSEDFSSQVVANIYKIQLSLSNGTNYLHARDFDGDLGLIEAKKLIEQIKEKGEVNMVFWKEGDPVYGSERYLQREPEIVALEKQLDREEQFYGPRQ